MTTVCFDIDWQILPEEEPAVSNTAGLMKIHINGQNATENHDIFSRTIHEKAMLSAYPLALWLATSWWRVLYEAVPLPEKEGTQNTDWQMAHFMPAAGYGFVWPLVELSSDGTTMTLTLRPHIRAEYEPLRYLNSFTEYITVADFSKNINQFLRETVLRLDGMDIGETPLHEALKTLQQEQSDPVLRQRRVLEASFGYDAETLPENVLQRMALLENAMGTQAMRSLGAHFAYAAPAEILRQLEIAEELSAVGIQGKTDIPPVQMRGEFARETPWEYGRRMAHAMRAALGLKTGHGVENNTLLSLFGITESAFKNTSPIETDYSLATSVDASDTIRINFKKMYESTGRRFALARILGNKVCLEVFEPWSVITGAKSFIQRVQRAFAAEFLCPLAGIREYANNNFSEKHIENTAEFFSVSPTLVRSQLVNHGLLHKESLAAY